MIDSLLAAVADGTRRRVLERLEGAEGGVREADLVEGEPSDAAVRLRHVHLPKLADAGLVEWDRDAGRVERGATFERVLPFLRTAREVEEGTADRRVPPAPR